jgi:hypothetical protein
MSCEIEDKEKIIKSCQALLESCDKPFVWEEDNTYEYLKPFNLFQQHPQIDTELKNLLEKLSGFKNPYDQIKAICTLDKEWFEYGTYGLDRDFTRYFSKFTLKPEYVEQVKSYFNNRLNELKNL